jgi:hypothetical protein
VSAPDSHSANQEPTTVGRPVRHAQFPRERLGHATARGDLRIQVSGGTVFGGGPALCLRPCCRKDMVRASRIDLPQMLNVTGYRTRRSAHWCALVVMVAACSLAIRVATRYGSSESGPTSKAETARSQDSWKHGRQRLTKDASAYTPPQIAPSGLEPPVIYGPVAYEGPKLSPLIFVSYFYYRPPPNSGFLS